MNIYNKLISFQVIFSEVYKDAFRKELQTLFFSKMFEKENENGHERTSVEHVGFKYLFLFYRKEMLIIIGIC